ncbi:SGNH hydrolase domain-containing protein [Agrococcus carbonis]|uniref:SGNH domain-containing protein n=1 Tax=Agrococcus carbonis TaxID=684552 RepID=A0A1H1QGR6_9MICO|nr:SGNH hydrolase domain-containing protein [Agrococcus carbonis]SDS22615.1 hypothetical protein SAMN04489719_1832 [Agrococcus carbonis]
MRGRPLALVLALGVALGVMSPAGIASATSAPQDPVGGVTASETPTATESPTATEPPAPTQTPAPSEPAPSAPPTETPAPTETASSAIPEAPVADAPEALDRPAAPEPTALPSIWMTADATWVRFGRKVTVTGKVWEGSTGIADAPVRIVGLSARTGRWELLATVPTRADGRFTYAFTPLSGYRIKAEILADERLRAAASRSRSFVVQPGIANVTPRGTSSVSIGAEHVVTGALYAQLEGRRVKLEGYSSRGWTTIVQTYASSTGAFALRYTVRDASISRLRVVVPSGGGLVVAAAPQLALRVLSTPQQLAAAHPPCFGAAAILDAACSTTGTAGALAPTTDSSRLFAQTGGAFSSACWQSDKTALVPICHAGSSRSDALRVAFIGDSHAAGYFATMKREFEYWNWSVDSYLGVSCRWEHVPRGHGCEPRYRQLAAAAASGEYDLVVYTGLRFPYADRPEEAVEIRDRYAAAWRPVVDAGIPLIVMGDFPHIGGALSCVTESPGAAPFGCAVPQTYGTRGHDPILEAAALVPGVRVVDPMRYFCIDGSCPLVIGGAIVYRDAHHLTGTYLTSVSSKIMWELRRAAR